MTTAVDVGRLIDGRPVDAFQYGIVALCALIVFAEGFDAQAIGYVAPSIGADWHLPKGALGPVFAAGLAGIMLGSLLVAPLADRVGRRPVIIASTLLFGLLTLATPFATDIWSLALLRAATGFGLGGAMPNAIALTSEYSPARRRTLLVMLMFNGFSLGSAAGGFAAASLVPAHGWQAVFVVGGVVPLLLLPVLWMRLPESLRFLATRSGRDGEAVALLRRIAPEVSRDSTVAVEVEAQQGGVVELFSEGRAAVTLLLWTIFFMSLLDLYLIVNWLPTTLAEAGSSVGQAAVAGAVFQLGGLIGTVVIGVSSGRVGTARALTLAYLLAAACIASIAATHGGSPVALAAVAGAGFGVLGAQIGANAFAATFYPTRIRSTGVGWALGIGRIGSIVGPLVGGVLLATGTSPGDLFLAGTVPVLIAAIAAAVIGFSRPDGAIAA